MRSIPGQRSLSQAMVQRLVVVVCERKSSRCDSEAYSLCYSCVSVGQRENHPSGCVQVRSRNMELFILFSFLLEVNEMHTFCMG